MSDCRLLVRRRLLELMAERWTRRVVCVVAGPGFGKSVLLAQAAHENRLDPRGAELTVVCDERDGSPASFLGRVAVELERIDGCRGPISIGPEPLLAELARRWPRGVCLAVDDVHHMTAPLRAPAS